MAAATHIVGSAQSSSSSTVSPPPPWHPVILVPNNEQQQQHHVLHDLDLATPSAFPSPTTPAATGTASPPRPNHTHLRPAASHQRRPRPSRKLQPTTYISADAASFRRMVHQVTGFDDDVMLLHMHGGPVAVAAPGPEVLCRQAPPSSCAGLETPLLLPTLDTSAFLMLGAPDGGGDSGRGGSAPARPPGVSSCCHSGSSVVGVVDPSAAALQVKAEAACGGGGFPSLEPWDDDDALFLEFARR